MVKKIARCEITSLRFKNDVHVMYNDGTVEKLFDYYPDELTFTEREFIGLTKVEAIALFRYRDMTYLRN